VLHEDVMQILAAVGMFVKLGVCPSNGFAASGILPGIPLVQSG
jgi:hypothetical protein